MAEQQVRTPYDLLGGEVAVIELVERFYGYMDSLSVARPIRQLHAQDLTDAKTKLVMFLSGWLGGPDLFVQAFGHPRLRQRHFRFAIGESEVEQWLLCMHTALADMNLAHGLAEQLAGAFTQLARHMANRA